MSKANLLMMNNYEYIDNNTIAISKANHWRAQNPRGFKKFPDTSQSKILLNEIF